MQNIIDSLPVGIDLNKTKICYDFDFRYGGNIWIEILTEEYLRIEKENDEKRIKYEK